MNKSLLDYYQENLEYLRDQASDFAREFPKIAARLEITENECADPYVERLLEGTAFLASRVERKLDESAPHLLESVLGSAIPGAFDLIPSFAVAELKDPDRSVVAAAPKLPAGSRFEIVPEGSRTPCIFTTMLPVTFFPVTLLEAKYLTLDLGKFGVPGESGLYMRFRKDGELSVAEEADDLLIYLNMQGTMASRLQQHIQTERKAVYTVSNGETKIIGDLDFSIPMLDEDPADGDRNLFEHFAVFPAGFRFLKLHGFSKLLKQTKTKGDAELIITFGKRCPDFSQSIDLQSVCLNCVPVCNLFRKQSDRMPLEIKVQHHLVPDRTAPLDYEVSRVLGITLFDNGNQKLLTLSRLYETDLAADSEDSFNFFSVQRVPRQRGDTERRRSSYTGQEIFVSFSGAKYREIRQEAVQFSTEMLCTNRDLPLFLHRGAVLKAKDFGAFRSAMLITSPTAPGEPLLSASDTEYMEKASCLMVSFADILWSEGVVPGELLQKIIQIHIPAGQSDLSGLARSITAMESTREVFRYVQHGQVFFESGWRVRLVLDEFSCAGIGVYAFGCVLRNILKNRKPVNLPAKIVLETKQQGRIAEWMI